MPIRSILFLLLALFRIFERQSGIGGAWWINRYPGVACDIPSIFYSYSFAPNYSSPGVFASGSEIVEYLNSVASKYQLADKIECEREITEIRWLEEPEEWELVISHMSPGTGDLSSSGRQHRIKQHGEQSVYLKREKARAKIVVSCVGMLSEPNDWPSDVPGLESFEGSVVHSARWKNDISLAGEDVLVIGAGSSTAQLVPCLLSDKTQVKSVTQVIRDPPWVVPRIEEPGGKEAYARQAPRIFKWCPLLGPFLRACIFCYVELNWFTVLQSKNQKRRSEQEAFALNHMRNLVPGEYHRAMTPTYSYGCKRSVLDQDWLRSMNSPKFQLCTRPLKCVRAREVVLHGSDDYPADLRIPADVIVLGNGFQATKWLHPLRVIGRGGKLLQDIWNERGGPQAYMGTAVDGFPNLFLVGGPNTFLSHTSVIIASENFTKFIIKVAKPVLQGDARFVEARIGAYSPDARVGTMMSEDGIRCCFLALNYF
ncbi:MAG: hypothetical protein M1820_006536 [Bogoriella megaspora]|nr:MAG: hypothetical protein M1820_006536 [Bogoriella megaspora]